MPRDALVVTEREHPERGLPAGHEPVTIRDTDVGRDPLDLYQPSPQGHPRAQPAGASRAGRPAYAAAGASWVPGAEVPPVVSIPARRAPACGARGLPSKVSPGGGTPPRRTPLAAAGCAPPGHVPPPASEARADW